MVSAPLINLAKNKKVPFVDQFIRWALSVGRVVIIGTELVAMGAFLYRFGLDKQLIDLHDKIAQEQNIIQYLKKNEDTYRNMQARLSIASSVITNQETLIKQYQDISNLLPSSIDLKNFIWTEDSVHIDGTIQSIASLTNFLNDLKQYPTVASVSLDKIENKTSLNLIAFSITANFKKTGGKKTQ